MGFSDNLIHRNFKQDNLTVYFCWDPKYTFKHCTKCWVSHSCQGLLIPVTSYKWHRCMGG